MTQQAPRRLRRDCRLCQRAFRALPEEDACPECRQEGGGPELATGY